MSEVLAQLKQKKGGGDVDDNELRYEKDFTPPQTTFPVTLEVLPLQRTYEFIGILPTGTNKCLFSFGGSNSAGGAIFLSTTEFILFANSQLLKDSSLSIPTGEHHFAIILKSGQVELYVDKVLYKTYSANATNLMKTAISFVIGSNESATAQNWNGGTLSKLAVTTYADGTFIL